MPTKEQSAELMDSSKAEVGVGIIVDIYSEDGVVPSVKAGVKDKDTSSVGIRIGGGMDRIGDSWWFSVISVLPWKGVACVMPWTCSLPQLEPSVSKEDIPKPTGSNSKSPICSRTCLAFATQSPAPLTQ